MSCALYTDKRLIIRFGQPQDLLGKKVGRYPASYPRHVLVPLDIENASYRVVAFGYTRSHINTDDVPFSAHRTFPCRDCPLLNARVTVLHIVTDCGHIKNTDVGR